MQTLTLTRAEIEAREITDRHLGLAARASLGSLLLVVGVDGFFQFLPHVHVASPLAAALQIAVGALLLANRYVALAVLAALPLVVQLVAAYATDHGRMSLPLVAVAFELYLLWANRDALRLQTCASATSCS